MDRLDLFSIVSDVFPRLAAVIAVTALLVCPDLVSSMVISMARERGAEAAAELDRILMSPRDRYPVRDHTGGSHRSTDR
jgi:hypothetical protein